MSAEPLSAQHVDPPPVVETTRWRRYGHDRLYVTSTASGTPVRLGFRDLVTGADHPEAPEHGVALAAAADRWTPAPAPAPGRPVGSGTAAPAPVAPVAPVKPWIDLSLNEPGAGVHERALAERAEAPVRTTLARVLGVHTDERAWRLGAKGESLVGKELARLGRRDPRWRAIHAVPVGRRGADIDHVVVGPGGVFTVNAKHHPDATVWAGGDVVMVNGTKVPYVRNARHEAARAARLLGAASGVAVPVMGVVAPVGCKAPMTIRSQPRDVAVVARRDLVDWFGRTGAVLDEDAIEAVWQAARRSTTWLD